MNKFLRITVRTVLWSLAGLLTLLLSISILIKIPKVQNYIVGKVTTYLEKELQTTVRIGYVHISFPKNIVLENVYFEDQQKDTLLSGEKLYVDINMLKLLKNTVEINEIKLKGIHSSIKRNDRGEFNFDFIINTFANEDNQTDKDPDTPPLKINIDKVKLDDIYFLYSDQWTGISAEVKLNHLDTRIKTFDLNDNMTFVLPRIMIDGLKTKVKQWTSVKQDSLLANVNSLNDTSQDLLPNIGIESIKLSNIEVAYEDAASKLSSIFFFDHVTAEIDEIDLNKEWVSLKLLALEGSDSKISFGTNKSIQVEKDSDSIAQESSVNWKVFSKKTIINDTHFRFDDENETPTDGFDYAHIALNDLNLDLRYLYFSTDSISGSLKNLSVIDHSGFDLKKLQADFTYTNTGATIQNLLAETATTRITDFLEISYPSLEVLDKKPELISIKARLNKSQIDMKDIHYFAPFLDTMEVMIPLMDKNFKIEGEIEGRLNNLHISKLLFSTLQSTELIASAHIQGLPDIDKVNIDLQLDKFTSSKHDLDQLIAKSMLPDSIQFPNHVYSRGTFKGGMKGFATDFSLNTDEGNVKVAGNLDMHVDTSYRAQISVSNVDLGHILNQDSILGIIDFDIQLQGKGLNPKNMVADLQGKINKIEALDYSYEDLSFDMQAQAGTIKGIALSPDPNIQFNLSLMADVTASYPAVNLNLMIDSINLQNLNITEDNIRYHGKIVADIPTADLNYLNGQINVVNSSIAYNNERFTLDTISLKAISDSSRNMLLLNSEFLTAHLTGKYKLLELNNSVKDIVQVYYNPDGEITDTLNYTPQNFEFSANIKPSKFVSDFLPELQQLEGISLDGRFNSEDKTLMAKLIAPKIMYDGMEFSGLGADIITVDSTLYYSILLEKMQVSTIELINTTISGEVIQNHLHFGIWIKDKLGKDQYHLGAHMSVLNNNYILSLLEDGFMLNYDNWDINPDNQLTFGNKGLHAQNFTVNSEEQSLSILSIDTINNAPLDVRFKNFRIETLSKLIESEGFSFGGGINGKATISRLESSPVFVSDLTVDRFYFDKDTIGNINIQVNNVTENTFGANIKVYGNHNDVNLVGKIIAPPNEASRIEAKLHLQPLTIHTLQAFSMGNLQKSEGDVKGVLDISGELNAPTIRGELLFVKAKLNPSMLNSDLLIDQQKVFFDNQGINFRNFEIKDARNNIAKLNGSILTKNYFDYTFNLNVTSNDFEVVNSTRENNDLFFGKLYVTSNIRIRGDLNKPIVDGNIKANEKTDIAFVVPNDNPGVIQREGVVKFVDRSDTLTHNVFARLDSMTQVTKLSGIDLTLNLQTDRLAKFQIILDEGTNEALHISGVAELNSAIDASDKITMSGTFTVENGEYVFNFGPVSRKFNFEKGSTITWNGDPLDAQMHITALYKERFPTLELVQNQIGAESPNLYKQRIPFDVKLLLAGELFKPEINFDIDLDENNAIVPQDVVSKVNIALSSLREDPAELNKQVFSLIILGRFMSANPFESLSGGGGAENIARNTVTSLLNSQLNALASDLITGVELDFNLQSEEDYLTGSGQHRTDLNIGISKMLFDDRLKITVGSNFEVEGGARPGEKTNNIAGDISLDYQLSKDGRYFARVYRKNEYQATLQGQYVETGIGFIINMNYNKFRELFMNSRALQNYYNPESRGFRRRFDVERMEVDSVYRDSVRQVIRDSLYLNNPEYRQRREKRKAEEVLKKEENDTTGNSIPKESSLNTVPIHNNRNEDDDTLYYEN